MEIIEKKLDNSVITEIGNTKIELKPIKTVPLLPAPAVVEFRNVSKKFGDHYVIKDVNFVIDDIPNKGEFIAILGPSGCGKSTILRIIAGLEPHFPPTEGQVFTKGKVIEEPGADRGMVFQDYTSFPYLCVLDNVAFGLRIKGIEKSEAREISREWIAKVGLKGHEYKYPHQLSGGMQQRVAIARTLALKPKIILMDEPFGALDPPTRYDMQWMLAQLWREVQATVFLITHSITEAVYLGDRIFLMSKSPGTLLEEIEVPPPDIPPLEMEQNRWFQEIVLTVRHKVHKTNGNF
jgi:NitT/TauT family transport system ATP-binding protein